MLLVASLLLVVRPGAPSSFLFLVAMPGAPSIVLSPSNDGFFSWAMDVLPNIGAGLACRVAAHIAEAPLMWRLQGGVA